MIETRDDCNASERHNRGQEKGAFINDVHTEVGGGQEIYKFEDWHIVTDRLCGQRVKISQICLDVICGCPPRKMRMRRHRTLLFFIRLHSLPPSRANRMIRLQRDTQTATRFEFRLKSEVRGGLIRRNGEL